MSRTRGQEFIGLTAFSLPKLFMFTQYEFSISYSLVVIHIFEAFDNRIIELRELSQIGSFPALGHKKQYFEKLNCLSFEECEMPCVIIRCAAGLPQVRQAFGNLSYHT
jgi:hypothetical protein